MPIHRVSTINGHIDRLEDAVKQLREELQGRDPNANVFSEYALNPDDFKKDFRDIKPDDLEYKASQVTTALKLVMGLRKPDKTAKLHKSR